jgi:hypothetical protein
VTSKTPSPLSKLDAALAADISAVSPIDAVASILEVNLPHDWDGIRRSSAGNARSLDCLRRS